VLVPNKKRTQSPMEDFDHSFTHLDQRTTSVNLDMRVKLKLFLTFDPSFFDHRHQSEMSI